MAQSSILILGAGELGLAMLRGLATHPMRLRTRIAILLRGATVNSNDPEKVKQVASIRSLDIDIVSGDIISFSPGQLSTIFAKYDTVVNCFGMSATPGTQVKVAQAAIASGCKKYFPWQYGVDYDIIGRKSVQDLFTEQLEVRDLLRGQSRMAWTIVSTGIFTSFIFVPSFGIINENRDMVAALGSWDNKVTATTPDDIGKVTAEIILAHPDLNGVVYTAGDTVSMKQIAEIVDTMLQTKVKRVEKSIAALKEELEADPDDMWKKYRVVFGEGIGVSWPKDKTFNAQHTIPMKTVEDWARVHL